MNKFEGILFDVDGTLASTNDLIFASFNHVAEKYLNKKLSNDEIIALFGPTEDVILKNWMEDRYDSARLDYFNFYQNNHETMAGMFGGLDKTLELIKSKNLPLGIFTGKGKDSAVITLKELGIYDYFDLIITGDDVNEHKPSPEGIDLFINKFNLNRDKVLMVGDSIVDVEAAEKANVKSALVLWDQYAKEKYSMVNGDFVFHSVDKFVNFIENNI